MKKLFVLSALSLLLGVNSSAQTQRGGSPEETESVVNVTVTGPTYVCPNEVVSYTGYTNTSGLNYTKIEFKCGGGGIFQATGSNMYTITGSYLPNNYTAQINWGNNNGSQNWIQVTYWWSVFGITYSSFGVLSPINVGVTSHPNAISGPASICSDDFGNYTVSCPNSLPYGCNDYEWTATNAIISGNSNTATLHATNANPIVVTVKFREICTSGIYYSNPYSYTITRPLSKPLGAGYVLSHLESMGPGGELFTDMTFPAKPYSYNWSAAVNNSGTITNSSGIVPAGTSVTQQFSLLATGSTLNIKAYYADPNCGNYWNYTRTKSGLAEGSHNRQGNFDTEISSSTQDENLNVYPNPANDNLNISYYSEKNSLSSIVLTDVVGNIIISKEQLLNEGQNDLNLEVSELPAGIYFLNFTGKGFSQKRKIIIEK